MDFKKYLTEGKKIYLQIYYQTVTPESAENGDFEDQGEEKQVDCTPDKWDIKDGKTPADLAYATIYNDYGGVEASSGGSWSKGLWYTTTDADTNYRTSEDTYYTFHPEGFTPEEEKKLFDLIKKWDRPK